MNYLLIFILWHLCASSFFFLMPFFFFFNAFLFLAEILCYSKSIRTSGGEFYSIIFEIYYSSILYVDSRNFISSFVGSIKFWKKYCFVVSADMIERSWGIYRKERRWNRILHPKWVHRVLQCNKKFYCNSLSCVAENFVYIFKFNFSFNRGFIKDKANIFFKFWRIVNDK